MYEIKEKKTLLKRIIEVINLLQTIYILTCLVNNRRLPFNDRSSTIISVELY